MRHAFFVVKAIISVAILWYIFRSVNIESLFAQVSDLRLIPLALCLTALVLQLIVAAWRWRIIGSGLGHPVRLGIMTRFVFVGQFFNQVLPSTIGGDMIRAWLFHRTGASIRDAVHSTLIDRIGGLLVLLALVLPVLPISESFIPDAAGRLGLALVAVGGLLGFGLLMLLAGSFGRWLEWTRPTRLLRDLAMRMRGLAARPRLIAGVFASSLLVHAGSITALWFLGRSLSLPLDLLDVFAVVPPSLLVSMIPISIAGWGLREGVIVTLLGFIGVPVEGALLLSLLFGVSAMLVSLPGAVLWLSGGPAGRAELVPNFWTSGEAGVPLE